MTKHEQQHCPRCNDRFECKIGSISLCQCAAVQLNDEERAYIRDRFDDCLCAGCMQAMKTEYGNSKLKRTIDQLPGIIPPEK